MFDDILLRNNRERICRYLSMLAKPMKDRITERIISIDGLVSKNGFSSFDPYDGLLSPLTAVLIRKSRLLSRIWTQSVKLFPLNIRPLVGIKKIVHTKTVSDFASAYAILLRNTGDAQYREKAILALRLLEEIRLPTRAGYGWGLRFPFTTRFVRSDSHTPNIFQSVNAIHSFLDAFEVFHDEKYLEIARKGFQFLVSDLGFVERDGTTVWNYWKGLSTTIFNVNGLMVGLCGRMWAISGETTYRTYCRKTYNLIRMGQNADGSWCYSDDQRGKFIDGFHTGYILEGISRAILAGVLKNDEIIAKAVDYYRKNFYASDLTPKYYPQSVYPIDVQNAAQALQTQVFLNKIGLIQKESIFKCFEKVDSLLWNTEGYYNYKRTRLFTYTTPMHRWGTGPMFLALAHLSSI